MHAIIGCFLIPLLTIAAGCSPNGEQGTDATHKLVWTYESTEHGFSLDLPSKKWKQKTKPHFIADFWCPTRLGSPMLAAVTSVKKQTKKQFEAAIPAFKANLEKNKNYLQKPTFQEGDSDHPYIYASMVENGTAKEQYIYVATAAIWLPEKGITVTTFFEGQGQMKSKTFKSIEYADFAAAAKLICLSPK